MRVLLTTVAVFAIFSATMFTDAQAQNTANKQTAADSSKTSENKSAAAADEKGFKPLFDGKVLDGWNGDRKLFRIEDSAIVGGMLDRKISHNYFLTHKQEFGDFELRLKFKLIGESTNAGIQIRSRRIPDHHEMIGYQADLGQNYWGALYDESRRRKVLARPAAEKLNKVLKKSGWNDYRIRCKGRRIQLWINGLQTVDYTEPDKKIEQKGLIGLQIHGGKAGEAWYKNIRIREL